MLSKEEARSLVAAQLAQQPPMPNEFLEILPKPYVPEVLVIWDERTIERDWGWVFFYNSERFLKTKDPGYAIVGNAPYIVNRHTGEVRPTGTGRPIEHYIAEYERGLGSR